MHRKEKLFSSGSPAMTRDASASRESSGDAVTDRALRAMFQTTTVGIVFQNPRGEIITANAAAEEILGLTRDQMLGAKSIDPAWRSVHEDGSPFPGTEHPAMRALAEGKEIRGEIMGVHNPRRQSTTWIEIDAVPLRDERGDIAGVYATFKDITPELEAKRFIHAQSLRLQSYFETPVAGVLFTSPDGTILDANRTLCRTLGFAHDEIVGRNWKDFSHPDELARDTESYDVFLEQRSNDYPREHRVRCKDGSFRWFAITLTATHDEAGRLLFVTCTALDIDTLKHLRSTLSSSEARYDRLFQDVPVAIWEEDISQVAAVIESLRASGVHDLRRHLLGHPELLQELGAFFHVTGLNREAHAMASGVAWIERMPRLRDVLGESGTSVLTELVLAIAAGEDKYSREVEYVDHRGEKRTAMVRARLPVGPETKERRAILTCEDLTEQVRLARELSKFKTLSDRSRFGRVLTDAFGNVEYVNDSYATSVGLPAERLLGRPIAELWRPDCVEIASEALRTLRESGAWSHPSLIQGADEPHAYPASVHATAVRDENGAMMYADFTFIDISERIALENQLRESQKMEAVGQLAGGVAHDFNNLLQAMVGFAELARSAADRGRSPDPELDQILTAAERAKHLVRQLLAFGRRQQLEPGVAELNGMLVGHLAIIRRMIGEHIEIAWKPAPEPIAVNTDRGAMLQVLMNLCVNGRDAMPQGGTLTITTGHGEIAPADIPADLPSPAKRYAWFTVADTGAGIPAAHLDRIFMPFFTTKGVGRGTGLGLATVYGLARQLGGFVRVESVEGQGAEFRVYLPLSSATIDPRRASETHPSLEPYRGTETILLAEDEESVRTVAREVLEHAGYRVIAAEDGAEAVSLFEDFAAEIDLALLDVVMPRMSGRKVRTAILARKPGLPILFCSGYTGDSPGARAASGDEPQVLGKPYNTVDLLRHIRTLLDEAKARDASSPSGEPAAPPPTATPS